MDSLPNNVLDKLRTVTATVVTSEREPLTTSDNTLFSPMIDSNMTTKSPIDAIDSLWFQHSDKFWYFMNIEQTQYN